MHEVPGQSQPRRNCVNDDHDGQDDENRCERPVLLNELPGQSKRRRNCVGGDDDGKQEGGGEEEGVDNWCCSSRNLVHRSIKLRLQHFANE